MLLEDLGLEMVSVNDDGSVLYRKRPPVMMRIPVARRAAPPVEAEDDDVLGDPCNIKPAPALPAAFVTARKWKPDELDANEKEVERLRAAAFRVIEYINREVVSVPKSLRADWDNSRALFHGFLNLVATPKIDRATKDLREQSRLINLLLLCIRSGQYQFCLGLMTIEHFEGLVRQISTTIGDCLELLDQQKLTYRLTSELDEWLDAARIIGEESRSLLKGVRVMGQCQKSGFEGYVNTPIPLPLEETPMVGRAQWLPVGC